jgi:cytochrome c-type biogenesis protein CcmH
VIRRGAFTLAVVALLALAAVVVVRMVSPGQPATPAQVEAQLAAELRCPDCQGLSIAESHTTSAAAIRSEIAQQVASGRTEAQVRDYFVARYGQWILLEPASALWLVLPFALVALAAAGLVLWLRSGRHPRAGAAAEAVTGVDPAALEAATLDRIHDEVETLDA